MKSKLINLIKLGIKKKEDTKQKNLKVKKIKLISILGEDDNFKIVNYKNHKHISIKNKSDNNSFKKLFEYINGKNNGNIIFDMTSPVLQRFDKVDNKVIPEMFFFIIPDNENDRLPAPVDKEIERGNSILKDKYFAQIKYKRFIFDFNKKDKKKYTELINKIDNFKYKNKLYFKASYNSPFTLIKQFEIWVELEDFTE